MKISHGVEFWNRNLKSEDRFPTRDNSSTLRRLINRGEGKKFSGSTVSKTKSGDAFERQRNPELVREFVSIPSSPPLPLEDWLPTEITRALRADNRIIAAQAIFLLGRATNRDTLIPRSADISSAPEIFFSILPDFSRRVNERERQILIDTISKDLSFRKQRVFNSELTS